MTFAIVNTLKTYPKNALIAVLKESRSKSVYKDPISGVITSGATCKFSWVSQVIINRNGQKLIAYSTEFSKRGEDLDFKNFYTVDELVNLMEKFPRHALWSWTAHGQFMNPVKYSKILQKVNYKHKLLNQKTLLLATANNILQDVEIVP